MQNTSANFFDRGLHLQLGQLVQFEEVQAGRRRTRLATVIAQHGDLVFLHAHDAERAQLLPLSKVICF